MVPACPTSAPQTAFMAQRIMQQPRAPLAIAAYPTMPVTAPSQEDAYIYDVHSDESDTDTSSDDGEPLPPEFNNSSPELEHQVFLQYKHAKRNYRKFMNKKPRRFRKPWKRFTNVKHKVPRKMKVFHTMVPLEEFQNYLLAKGNRRHARTGMPSGFGNRVGRTLKVVMESH